MNKWLSTISQFPIPQPYFYIIKEGLAVARLVGNQMEFSYRNYCRIVRRDLVSLNLTYY